MHLLLLKLSRASLSSVWRLENIHKHVLLRLEQREITMRQPKNLRLRKAVWASRCTRRSRWTAWISDRIPRSYVRIASIITAMFPAIWIAYKKISVLWHQLSSLLKIFQSILESLHVFGPGPWKCRENKHPLGPPHSHLVLLQPDHVETAPCKNMQSRLVQVDSHLKAMGISFIGSTSDGYPKKSVDRIPGFLSLASPVSGLGILRFSTWVMLIHHQKERSSGPMTQAKCSTTSPKLQPRLFAALNF